MQPQAAKKRTPTAVLRPDICELRTLSGLGIDWHEFDEIAAITEFDGDRTRYEAEIIALRQLSGIPFKNKFQVGQFEITGEIPMVG